MEAYERSLSTPKVLWTITLGQSGRQEYLDAITKRGIRVSEAAADIVGNPQFTCAGHDTEISLNVFWIETLGFRNRLGFRSGAHYVDVCTRAAQIGLQLCPAEVGPALRLAYYDQKPTERLFVAMDAIPDSRGHPSMFMVTNEYGTPNLQTYWDEPRQYLALHERIVFVQPRLQ